MAAILLAEESVPSELRLENCLMELGHRVTSVADAELVRMVKNHPFDLIIWAIDCFDENVQEIFEQVRLFSDVPVLGVWPKVMAGGTGDAIGIGDSVPSGRKGRLDTMLALPIDKDELEESVSYYLREAYKRSHDMRLYQYKDLKMSSGSIKKVEMNHKGLDLTVKEYMILSLLMRHRNRIYTKASLYEAVWRQPYTGDDNAVKIHISNLRSKLKKADPETKYIETVWGLGYRLSKN